MPTPNFIHHCDIASNTQHFAAALRRRQHARTKLHTPFWSKAYKILWQQYSSNRLKSILHRYISMQINILNDELIFPNYTPELYPELYSQIIFPRYTPTQTLLGGLLILRSTYIDLEICFAPQRRLLFLQLKIPKMDRNRDFLLFLNWKYASPCTFVDILTSENGPNMENFTHSDLEIRFVL